MNPLTDIAIGAVGKVIDAVGNAADSLITSDEERLKAEVELARIELDRDKAAYADTANSRDSNVRIQESANASFLAKNVGYWLDLFIVTATFGMAYLILFKAIPPENKEVFFTAFGSLLTLCLTVVQWHRGSSSRSADKDNTIKMLADK